MRRPMLSRLAIRRPAFRRPSIRATMFMIFALMTAMMAGFAATSLIALTEVNSTSEELSGRWLPAINAARDIELAMERTRVAYGQHLSASTQLDKSSAEEAIKKASDEFLAAVEHYKPLAVTDRDKQLVGVVEKAFGQYSTFGANMVELSNKGDMVMAASVFSRNMKMVAGIAANSISEIVRTKAKGTEASIANSKGAYDLAVKVVSGLIGAVLVVALAATLYTARGITGPVQRLTRAMEALARGDVSTAIPFTGRADELGKMAGAVSVFREALISSRALEEEAERTRSATEAEREEARRRAEADADRRLSEATSGLAAGLKRLASGDLSFELDQAFSGEFEALRHDFNASVRQLRDTLEEVVGGVQTIDGGAQQIAEGANDLARRTEQQAASLEETAAALDQITVNVTTSARRTDEARTVASRANDTAGRSEKVVTETVDAMHRIEQASGQIASIIGVIDEIAFQTNLLALNAGVEAARAGDAGKGFAVVAQEVRELAQRSANAAREIKSLIERSTREVENGVRLVGETGGVLKAIGEDIVTIHGHMEAIAIAAREQSSGLAEVNNAVNHMDQVTQQNAAMVEETSASSLTLKDEVMHLRSAIGRFRLAGEARAVSGRYAA